MHPHWQGLPSVKWRSLALAPLALVGLRVCVPRDVAACALLVDLCAPALGLASEP